MKKFLFMAVFSLLSISSAMAQERRDISVDLAADHVDITTGFNGTTMSLFGTRRADGDIAVIVRGPEKTMYVRRKENIFGAWINKSSERFKGIPSYYNYALSSPPEQFFSGKAGGNNGIAPETIGISAEDKEDPARKEFHAALIRNKQKQGLYMRDPGTVKFISPDFFRADFYIPANVSVGEYEIETLYFSGGAVKDTVTRTIRVVQVGAAADIHEFAYRYSFLYGLLSVMLAIFAGWFSNRIRRG